MPNIAVTTVVIIYVYIVSTLYAFKLVHYIYFLNVSQRVFFALGNTN